MVNRRAVEIDVGIQALLLAHVEDDRVWMDAIGQFESRFGRQRSLDTETFELEHPRKRIGDGSIIVDDEYGPRRLVGDASGRGNHRIILKAKDMLICGRSSDGDKYWMDGLPAPVGGALKICGYCGAPAVVVGFVNV